MSDMLPGFDAPPPPKDAPKAKRLPQRERDQLAIEAGIHPATRLRLAENGEDLRRLPVAPPQVRRRVDRLEVRHTGSELEEPPR